MGETWMARTLQQPLHLVYAHALVLRLVKQCLQQRLPQHAENLSTPVR